MNIIDIAHWSKFSTCLPGIGRVLVLSSLLVSVSRMTLAETYYVRADGTAVSKFTATDCGSPATAMNVGKQNTQSYSPGDRIVLCHEGGVFRSLVYSPSSGSSIAPITYDGRGTAVIHASDLVTSWTLVGGYVYTASVSERPQQLFVDGVFADRKGGFGLLNDDHDWYWDSNTLYLFSSAGNPGTVYSRPGVEAGARPRAFGIGSADWIIIEGVTTRHGNYGGFKGLDPGSHIIIRNCTAEWNWMAGIVLSGNAMYSDITIEDNTVRNNGGSGIYFLGPGRDSVIRRNKCYRNGKFQSEGNEYEYQHRWTAGIKLWENTAIQEGNRVYSNEVYENGRGQEGDKQGRGAGIWFDGLRSNASNPNLIHHNMIYDNKGNGIFIEITSNTVIYGNVLHNNATNTGGPAEMAPPANIVIDARDNFTSENNLVYNNTCYGGRNGVKVVSYNGGMVNDNIVKNNIISNAEQHNLFCLLGGANDGVNGSENVYENNSIGAESTDFIRWGGDSFHTYSAWEIAYGRPANSIEGDPNLVGTTRNTLFLTETSPCVDSGAVLPPSQDEGLIETSTWPNSVVISNQGSHGSGWEVGAFVFSGTSTLVFFDGFEGGDILKWSGAVP